MPCSSSRRSYTKEIAMTHYQLSRELEERLGAATARLSDCAERVTATFAAIEPTAFDLETDVGEYNTELDELDEVLNDITLAALAAGDLATARRFRNIQTNCLEAPSVAIDLNDHEELLETLAEAISGEVEAA